MQCDYYDAGRAARAPSWAAPTPHSWPTRRPRRPWPPTSRGARRAVARAGASAESHYRNKAKLVVAGRAGRPTFGILDERGRGVDLRRCGLYEPGLAATFDPLHRFVSDLGIEPYDVPGRRGRAQARHRHPLPRRRAPRAVRRALTGRRWPCCATRCPASSTRCRRRGGHGQRPARAQGRARGRHRGPAHRRDAAPGARRRRHPPCSGHGRSSRRTPGWPGGRTARLAGWSTLVPAPCGTCTAASAGSRCTSRRLGRRVVGVETSDEAIAAARTADLGPDSFRHSRVSSRATRLPTCRRARRRPRRRQPASARHRPRPRRVVDESAASRVYSSCHPARWPDLEAMPSLRATRPGLRHVPPDDPPRDRRPPSSAADVGPGLP